MEHQPGELTTLLLSYTQGNKGTVSSLITRTYPELLRLARRLMGRERRGHTLSATALVHEGFIRLFGNGHPDFRSGRHFFLTAATVMQHILTDYARKKLASKRNGQLDSPLSYSPDTLIEVSELLERLERIDARAAEVVRLRFYMGMTVEEAAETLEITPALVQQDWKWARAWLAAATNGAWGAKNGPSSARRN